MSVAVVRRKYADPLQQKWKREDSRKTLKRVRGLYTSRAAHREFLQSSRIHLCCSLTQLPGMKALHLLTILSQGGICSPLPRLSSNVCGQLLILHKCTHYILEH